MAVTMARISAPDLRRSGWQLCLSLLAPIFLAACAVNSRLPPDAQFDQATASITGTGLIVMGVRVSREPQGHDWIVGSYALNPVYSFDLARINAKGRLGRPFRRLQICDYSRTILYGAFSPCSPEFMDYRVVSVPAGRYLLVDFIYQTHNLAFESNYINPNLRSRFGGLAGGDIGVGDQIRSPERSFSVGAGEIVYIGDMSFDASREFVTIELGRNDLAARAALNQLPGISGPMVFRSVAGGPP